MRAESIIRKMANPECWPISQEDFAESILDDLHNWHVFEYGDVVFTVGKHNPIMHFYADESGDGFYSAWNKFIADVWNTIGFNYMIAPIMNPRIKKVAICGGWESKGTTETGYEVFYIQRRT